MPQPVVYILVFFAFMAIVRFFSRKMMIRHYSRMPEPKKVSLMATYALMVRIYGLLFKLSPMILAAGLVLVYPLKNISPLTALLVCVVAYLFMIEDFFFRRAILTGLSRAKSEYTSRADL